jgi:hypothetical protein
LVQKRSQSYEVSVRSRLRVMSRQSPGNCVRLRAWPSSGTIRGERQQAHDLLAPVYGWFTEGFETLDLKEAKALLEQLKA